MDRWTYEVNLNSDIWNGEIFDTKEEAIAEGRKEAVECKTDGFKVGIIENAHNFGIDVVSVIEQIQEKMYNEMGEVAEDYLDDVTKDDLHELEEKLNTVYHEWQKKHSYYPSFYKVISEEIIEVD